MAAGAVAFLVVLASFLELAGWRGMGLVAAGFTVGLVLLYRRWVPEDEAPPKRETSRATPDARGSPNPLRRI